MIRNIPFIARATSQTPQFTNRVRVQNYNFNFKKLSDPFFRDGNVLTKKLRRLN